jgi:hypothetical protein
MKETYPDDFKKVMGDDFKDLTKTSLRTEKWDDSKITRFQALMKSEKFQKVMDDLTETDVKTYIKNAVDAGITDKAAIALYCRMQNA